MDQQGSSLSADVERQRQQLEHQEYVVWRVRRQLQDELQRRDQMRGALTVLERLQEREQAAAIQAMREAVAADLSRGSSRDQEDHHAGGRQGSP